MSGHDFRQPIYRGDWNDVQARYRIATAIRNNHINPLTDPFTPPIRKHEPRFDWAKLWKAGVALYITLVVIGTLLVLILGDIL